MPNKANIVVIGAGIIGASVAYHLAQRGVEDILLLDKGDLDVNDGSTSHAPGGVRVLTLSDWYTRLGTASRNFYDTLPLAVEGEEQVYRTGAVQVASTPERYESYKRLQEMGLTWGQPTTLLTPEEVNAKNPLIDDRKIVGGIWLPNVVTVNTSRLATSTRRLGEVTGNLTSIGNTEVTEVVAEGGRVRAVLTNNPEMPRIECEQVVLCSNIWAPILAGKLGVPMPLFPGQHQYIYTNPTPALDPFQDAYVSLPIMTMDDISIYYRQHGDRIGIGSYHHKAMLVDPHKLEKKAEFPFTPEDFTKAWSLMKDLMPALNDTKISHGINGMFAFTVDGMPIVGESNKVKGFWTSVGAWLSFAAELGNVLANWMTTGDPGMDMRLADVNRFHPYQTNHEYLSRQSKYFYEIGFDIIHPSQVSSSVRNLRLSPHHAQMQALGGETVPFAGTETCLWYESNAPLVEKYADKIPSREGWSAKFWSPIQGAEHLAVRDSVGLIDWSAGIGPIEVAGPDAAAYLNYLCTGNVDRAIGSVTYTLWLTPHGGVKRDVTVLRLAEESFWVMTGKANIPAEITWMRQVAESYAGKQVQIIDRSNEYMSLAIWGPNSRKVLEKVTNADVSNEGFPFYTAQEIGVGMVPTIAVRISYVGELGWEFYAPMNYGSRLYDTLWEAGQEFGMHPCGVGAVMSLRLEKGYRLYGADVHTEYTPYEAGLGWMVKLDKDDFVGREAAMAAKEAGLTRKLVSLTFDDPKTVMYGNEPVFAGDEVVGRVTSGNFGYYVGKFIALAYVPIEHADIGTQLRVRYNGNFYDGTVVNGMLLDAQNGRLKA